MKLKEYKQITSNNLDYVWMEPDFTHDFSKVKIGSIFVNIYGQSYVITKIEKDDCGRNCYYNGNKCLATQYTSPHNMLTKRPYFAYRWIKKKDI